MNNEEIIEKVSKEYGLDDVEYFRHIEPKMIKKIIQKALSLQKEEFEKMINELNGLDWSDFWEWMRKNKHQDYFDDISHMFCMECLLEYILTKIKEMGEK